MIQSPNTKKKNATVFRGGTEAMKEENSSKQSPPPPVPLSTHEIKIGPFE